MKFTNRGQAGLIVSERMDSQHLVFKIGIPEKFHDQLRMVNRGVRNGSRLVWTPYKDEKKYLKNMKLELNFD